MHDQISDSLIRASASLNHAGRPNPGVEICAKDCLVRSATQPLIIHTDEKTLHMLLPLGAQGFCVFCPVNKKLQ